MRDGWKDSGPTQGGLTLGVALRAVTQMADMNIVALTGRVTRDVELRHTPKQTAVCELGLAVSKSVKNADGTWGDKPVWVTATCWGKMAETASKFLGKGSRVAIEGELDLDEWEKDGKKHSRLKVNATKLVLLGERRDRSESQPQAEPQEEAFEF